MNFKVTAIVINDSKVFFDCDKEFLYLENFEAFLSKVLNFASGKKKPRIEACLKSCSYIRSEFIISSQSDNMSLVIERERDCKKITDNLLN